MPRGIYDRSLTVFQREAARNRLREIERADLAVKTARRNLVSAVNAVKLACIKKDKREKTWLAAVRKHDDLKAKHAQS